MSEDANKREDREFQYDLTELQVELGFHIALAVGLLAIVYGLLSYYRDNLLGIILVDSVGIPFAVVYLMRVYRFKKRRFKDIKEKYISTQPQKTTTDSKMSKVQAKDEILELIQWIDKQKCKLFKRWDVLSGWWLSFIGLLVIILFIMALSVAISVVSWISHVTDISITLSSIAVSLALLAVSISYVAVVAQFMERNIVRVNFNKALKLRQFNPNEKILLKALIKIKAKNLEFDLEQIYDMNLSMFTKERLLERLYEKNYT